MGEEDTKCQKRPQAQHQTPTHMGNPRPAQRPKAKLHTSVAAVVGLARRRSQSDPGRRPTEHPKRPTTSRLFFRESRGQNSFPRDREKKATPWPPEAPRRVLQAVGAQPHPTSTGWEVLPLTGGWGASHGQHPPQFTTKAKLHTSVDAVVSLEQGQSPCDPGRRPTSHTRLRTTSRLFFRESRGQNSFPRDREKKATPWPRSAAGASKPPGAQPLKIPSGWENLPLTWGWEAQHGQPPSLLST